MASNRSDQIASALHREIARQLREEPIYVTQRSLLNAARVRANSRGTSRLLVDRWEGLLRARDLDGLSHVLMSDDEESRAMRTSSVFQGVLPPSVRARIVADVLSAA